MTTRAYLTTKQTQILTVVHRGNYDPPTATRTPLDLDELLDRLPYETTKQSIHFSLRALINRGYLIKAGRAARRGRQRVLIDLGPAGIAYYAGSPTTSASTGPSTSVTVSIEEDGAEALLTGL